MTPERAAAIVTDYMAGLKMRTIEERYGVSRVEVNQALDDAGSLGRIKRKSRGIPPRPAR